MSRLEGRRYRDPAVDAAFIVRDAPDTAGRSTRELDREQVTIEYDDGHTQRVPHERFRGRMTYERVSER